MRPLWVTQRGEDLLLIAFQQSGEYPEAVVLHKDRTFTTEALNTLELKWNSTEFPIAFHFEWPASE